jgi:hypothetical protein
VTAGYAATFYGAAGIAVAGAVLLALTFRPRPPAAPSPAVDAAVDAAVDVPGSEPAPMR